MASEEQRKHWGGYDGFGEDKAYDFLIDRGWTEVRGKVGLMVPPSDRVPWEEIDAMEFLRDEWDYACLKDVYLDA